MSPTYNERRAYPRERVDIQADLWSQYHNMTVSVVELSEGGMGIANGWLPVRTAVHLRFDLPLTASVIRCEARVVWSDGESNRSGLQFTKIAEAEKRALINWLERHCPKAEAD
jgi:c-di-GMP-binding flagellar brake protein YcgR